MKVLNSHQKLQGNIALQIFLEAWTDLPDRVKLCGTVANTLQHGGAQGSTESPRTEKNGHLPLPAPQCNPVQMPQMPPLGLEESPKSSGNTGVSENHCADPCAQFSNSEQLAAIISAMDRNELEQRLLDLLKEIQPDTSE